MTVCDRTEKTKKRLFAIGDVHGCSRALKAIFAEMNPTLQDTVVILGDVVDRGPDSAGVIDMLLAWRAQTNLVHLVGNHEEMLLQVAEGALSLDDWTRHGGDKALDSYGVDHPSQLPASHLDFLRAAKLTHEQGNHLFAHACYLPHWPLPYTPRDVLLWKDADPTELRPHSSGKTVVLGHTPQPDGEILDLGFAVLVDTDCCHGGWLTALELNGSTIIQANNRGKMRRKRRYVRL